MVKAIVSRGEIRPLEPLPVDWQEGQRLRVEKADDGEPPVEERALEEARHQAKEQVRRHMGLA